MVKESTGPKQGHDYNLHLALRFPSLFGVCFDIWKNAIATIQFWFWLTIVRMRYINQPVFTIAHFVPVCEGQDKTWAGRKQGHPSCV